MKIIYKYLLKVILIFCLISSAIGLNVTPVHAAGGMSQIILGGYPDALNAANATEYNTLMGGQTWAGGTNYRVQVIPASGSISSLYVELSSSAGVGADDTYTFTIMYDANGDNVPDVSVLTCAITQNATQGSDIANTITVAPGRLICIRCVSSGNPSNTPNAQWRVKFIGDNTKESILMAGGGALSLSALRYISLVGDLGSCSAYAIVGANMFPTSGKIKNLYVSLLNDPGTNPDAFSYTLYYGNRTGWVAQALTCTITADSKTGSDTNPAHAITVSPGFSACWGCMPLNTPSSSGDHVRISCVFEADVNGESLLMGSTAITGASTTDYQFPYVGTTGTVSGTETNRQLLLGPCVVKKLYVELENTPSGAGKAFSFTFRNNSGSSTLACTVTNPATSANDTSHEVTVSGNYDNVSLMIVPTNAPSANRVVFGMVCYITPSVVTNRSYGYILH